jgi:hypothetical protein
MKALLMIYSSYIKNLKADEADNPRGLNSWTSFKTCHKTHVWQMMHLRRRTRPWQSLRLAKKAAH